jgi:hypothetical protein
MTDPIEPEAQRKQVIAQRNKAVALALAGLVILFFLITLVRVRA